MGQFLIGHPAPFRPSFDFAPALVWQSFVDAADAADARSVSRAIWRAWLPTGNGR
jgi:hypothetical protein